MRPYSIPGCVVVIEMVPTLTHIHNYVYMYVLLILCMYVSVNVFTNLFISNNMEKEYGSPLKWKLQMTMNSL